jgi:hypothetical protein
MRKGGPFQGQNIVFRRKKRNCEKKLKKIAQHSSLPTYLSHFLNTSTVQVQLVHLKHWYLPTKLHVTSQMTVTYIFTAVGKSTPTVLHVDT